MVRFFRSVMFQFHDNTLRLRMKIFFQEAESIFGNACCPGRFSELVVCVPGMTLLRALWHNIGLGEKVNRLHRKAFFLGTIPYRF